MERGPVDDVVFAHTGVIHGEAVVVFGCDDEIFHPGSLGKIDPRIGVELGWVELMGAIRDTPRRGC